MGRPPLASRDMVEETLAALAEVRPASAAFAGHPAPAGLPEADLLTAREGEVLRLMAAGLDNSGIAARLYIGVGTVKTHVNRLFAKLGAASRT